MSSCSHKRFYSKWGVFTVLCFAQLHICSNCKDAEIIGAIISAVAHASSFIFSEVCHALTLSKRLSSYAVFWCYSQLWICLSDGINCIDDASHKELFQFTVQSSCFFFSGSLFFIKSNWMAVFTAQYCSCSSREVGGERCFIFLPRTNFSMQCGTGLMTVMLMMLTLPPAPASVQ